MELVLELVHDFHPPFPIRLELTVYTLQHLAGRAPAGLVEPCGSINVACRVTGVAAAACLLWESTIQEQKAMTGV